jgi:hypothetical protein
LTADLDNNIVIVHNDDRAKIFLRDDEIVEVHLRPGRYNAEKVLGVIDKILQHTNRPKILVLVVTTPRSMVTFSGLVAVFSKPAVRYSMAKAYVFQTNVQFFLAHLGKLIFKPKTPIRFFRERAQAESWLRSFVGFGL